MPVLTQAEKDAILKPKVKQWIPQVAPTHAEGNVFFDLNKHVPTFQTDIPGVNINVNMESIRRVFNNTGTMIPNGTPCKQVGSDDGTGVVLIAPAQANTFINARVLLVMTHDIEDQATGIGTYTGDVSDLDLLSLAETGQTLVKGLPIYLSALEAGKYTMDIPDIATQVGGFLTGEQTVTPGNFAVERENLINLPTILAFMNNGSAGGTIDGIFADVSNYAASGNIVMEFDDAAGTITIPSDGIYEATPVLTLGYDILGNNEEDLVLRINGSTQGDFDIPIKLPRNGSGASFSAPISFNAIAGDIIKLQLACTSTTLTGVTYPLMNFKIKSEHIR